MKLYRISQAPSDAANIYHEPGNSYHMGEEPIGCINRVSYGWRCCLRGFNFYRATALQAMHAALDYVYGGDEQ
jgi:hypothetical protein